MELQWQSLKLKTEQKPTMLKHLWLSDGAALWSDSFLGLKLVDRYKWQCYASPECLTCRRDSVYEVVEVGEKQLEQVQKHGGVVANTRAAKHNIRRSPGITD